MDSAERLGVRLRSLHSLISKGFRHGGVHIPHTFGERVIHRIKSKSYSCCHSVLIFHFLAPAHTTIVLTIAAILSQGLASCVFKWPDYNILGFVGCAVNTAVTLLNSATTVRKQPQTIHKGLWGHDYDPIKLHLSNRQQMDKQNVVQLYNGTLLRNKKG